MDIDEPNSLQHEAKAQLDRILVSSNNANTSTRAAELLLGDESAAMIKARLAMAAARSTCVLSMPSSTKPPFTSESAPSPLTKVERRAARRAKRAELRAGLSAKGRASADHDAEQVTHAGIEASTAGAWPYSTAVSDSEKLQNLSRIIRPNSIPPSLIRYWDGLHDVLKSVLLTAAGPHSNISAPLEQAQAVTAVFLSSLANHLRSESIHGATAVHESTSVNNTERLRALAARLGMQLEAFEKQRSDQLVSLLDASMLETQRAREQVLELQQRLEDRKNEAVLEADWKIAKQELEEKLQAHLRQAQQLQSEIQHLKTPASVSGCSSSSAEPPLPNDLHGDDDQSFNARSPQHVIASIRRSFAVGLNVPPELVECFQSISANLDSAVSKLAQDIYSTGTQFMLELLQNADDNFYTPGVTPSFCITVTPDFIWTKNNEIGFSEENVRAICKVGGSTKKRERGQFIGNKGIGFKSVFKVTERPHIFSNGFHLRFDISRGRLGYILPEWIPAEELYKLPVPIADDLSLTHLFLPCNSADHRLRELDAEELFSRVDHVLLFLRRLKQLEIEVVRPPQPSSALNVLPLASFKKLCVHEDATSRVLTLTIQQLNSFGVLLLEEKQQFYVFRKVLPVPEDIPDSPSGERFTEIVLAFPLFSRNLSNTERTSLQDASPEPDSLLTSCSIYCFLPVRAVGFHFLIQADFSLVTSRQDVHKSKFWNQWLRSCVAPLFREAVLSESLIKQRLGDYLPAVRDVSDPFWQPVASVIEKLLQTEACIQTESGRWVSPSGAVLRPPGVSEFMLSNADLHTALGLEFAAMPKGQFAVRSPAHMMCRSFNTGDLILCLESAAMQALLPSKGISWFAALYSYFALHLRELTNQHRTSLLSLPIIILQHESFPVRLFEGPVFLDVHPTALSHRSSFDSSYDLSSCLRLVHSDTISADNRPFFAFLNISSAFSSDVVDAIEGYHHRLSAVLALDPQWALPMQGSQNPSDNKLEEKNPVLDVQQITQHIWHQLRFLRDHFNQSVSAATVLSLRYVLLIPVQYTTLPVSQGCTLPFALPCDTYSPSFRDFFAQCEARVPFVDFSTLAISMGEQDMENFLFELGLNRLPRMLRALGTNLAEIFSPEFDMWWNWQCRQGREGVSRILLHLNQYWQHYRHFSAICSRLNLLHSIPTRGNMLASSFSSVFAADCKEALLAFGDSVPYLDLELRSELLRRLGVHCEVDAAAVQAIEKYWRLKLGHEHNIAQWSTLYQKFQDLEIPPPATVFFPFDEKERPADLEKISSKFVPTKYLRAHAPPELIPWISAFILDTKYESELAEYLCNRSKNPSSLDIMQILSRLNFNPKSNDYRSTHEKKSFASAIQAAYKLLEEILTRKSVKQLPSCLILDSRFTFRSQRDPSKLKQLVLPDDLDIANLFDYSSTDAHNYFSVKFIHSYMMLPLLSTLLSSLIPSRSSAAHRQPIFEALVLDNALSLEYRACLMEVIHQSGRLMSAADLDRISRLAVNLSVHTTSRLHVCYTLQGITRYRPEKHWLDESRHLLVVQRSRNLGPRVDVDVLLQFPGFAKDADREYYIRLFSERRLQLLVSELPPEHCCVLPVDTVYEAAPPMVNFSKSKAGPSPIRGALSSLKSSESDEKIEDFPPLRGESILTFLPWNTSDNIRADSSSNLHSPMQLDSTACSVQSSDCINLSSSHMRPTHHALTLEQLRCCVHLLQQEHPSSLVAMAREITTSNSGFVFAEDQGLNQAKEGNQLLDMAQSAEVRELAKQCTELIGHYAELLAFQYLSNLSDVEISLHSWVSSARCVFFHEDPTISIDNAVGYDMSYRDKGSGRTNFVEVKGSLLPTAVFTLSANEYRCAQERGDQYEIICISLFPRPCLVHRLRNPACMEADGRLVVTPHTYSFRFVPSFSQPPPPLQSSPVIITEYPGRTVRQELEVDSKQLTPVTSTGVHVDVDDKKDDTSSSKPLQPSQCWKERPKLFFADKKSTPQAATAAPPATKKKSASGSKKQPNPPLFVFLPPAWNVLNVATIKQRFVELFAPLGECASAEPFQSKKFWVVRFSKWSSLDVRDRVLADKGKGQDPLLFLPSDSESQAYVKFKMFWS